MALTDTFVRNKKHSGKAGYDKHADAHGLYLAISPAGGKLWRMDYRFAGKRNTLALGAYPAVSLAKARQARDAAREALAEGNDPADLKRAAKAAQVAAAANSFEAVAREYHALKSRGVVAQVRRALAAPAAQGLVSVHRGAAAERDYRAHGAGRAAQG